MTLPDGRQVGPGDLVGQPRAGRTLVFSGDTRPTATLLEATRGADLLIHEATFGHEEGARAMETGHSTAHEAATIARDAGVRQLVLTYISARYNRDAPELAGGGEGDFSGDDDRAGRADGRCAVRGTAGRDGNGVRGNSNEGEGT